MSDVSDLYELVASGFSARVDVISDGQWSAPTPHEDWTVRGRLRAAWGRRRETGAQMLEVVVWDYNNDADAMAALQHQLEEIVHPVGGDRLS